MIISSDAEKASNKIPCPSTVKPFSKLEIEGNFHNLIKRHLWG